MRLRNVAIVAIGLIAAPTLAAADQAVTQKNQTFSSEAITVHAGESVHFQNADTVNHNITVRGGADDDSDDLGLQKPGAAVTYRFADKGVYRVICSIHPRMKMTVTVQ